MRDKVRVIRRTGELVAFDPSRIQRAIARAFAAVEGGDPDRPPIAGVAAELTREVISALERQLDRTGGTTVHIEEIQDRVEHVLMRAGYRRVARAYSLYREERARLRALSWGGLFPEIQVVAEDGKRYPLDRNRIQRLLEEAAADLPDVDPRRVLAETYRHLYDGMPEREVAEALVLTAKTHIESSPDYSKLAARLLLDKLRSEALSFLYGGRQQATGEEMAARYPEYFVDYVRRGVALGLLDPALQEFDLSRLGHALRPERDFQFHYIGLQILYDRYLLHHAERRFELPQALFMRVAMGLALREREREAWAIRFYDLISRFDYMPSTPTLFNAGTRWPQLSSCYLTTVPDDLEGIFDAYKENALLSKYAGGLGNDWTRVRAMGARIKGTNGKSQGVIPFLKIANDTAIAVNQSGKRKGAVCAYLEVWHLDIEEFMELRKPTGDERRRCHDMNTAVWIPDLFMKRLMEGGHWTLFSPDEVPDLHELVGLAFEERYLFYEKEAEAGRIKLWKRVPAVQLWRKLLSSLFETGHPWITFKDPCNLRYTNQHVGVVHSSNLCTEITLHTSDEETAVCNLGSINLANHLLDGGLDLEKLRATVRTAMRMLDNVIDINYYATEKARRSNLRHRPVGLGIMGFQDALYKLRIPYGSEEAVRFADRSMEAVSYFAIEASSDLARERGCYETFKGSLWSRGILPIDSLDLLAQGRGGYLQVDRSQSLDWDRLREKVKGGMRNSNCLAIAPTATIALICGVSQSIEPTFQNLYVKSNLSGEFTIINPYLVQDLKALGLWDERMREELRAHDGSVLPIERIPEALKQLYRCAFEIDPSWLIEAASRRQKWIDQAQSLNLYLAEPSGRKLDEIYKLAWIRGLKTTYYLRTLAASRIERHTPTTTGAPTCSIEDPGCEACQ